MTSSRRALAEVRRVALSLPGTSETTTFGHPTFRAGKKSFAVLERYDGDDVLSFKATLEDQAALVLDPRFFASPYVGQHGWTSLRLASGVERRELEELLRTGYRLVATTRMLAELESLPPERPRTRRHK